MILTRAKKEYREFIRQIKAENKYIYNHPTGKKDRLLKYLPSAFHLLADWYKKRV